MKKLLSLFLMVMLVFGLASCGGKEEPVAPVTETVAPTEEPTVEPTAEEPVVANGKIILSTTTSTQDSGLLDFLLPLFTAETGINVDVIAVGTGQAIRMGEDGEADVLLVHDTASEEKFVTEGHSSERRDVMYNDFIIIGPRGDEEGIETTFNNDITGALNFIVEKGFTFLSRGDDSGTHKKELKLWKETNTPEPSGEWYVSVGKGMGDTISMANEMQGYTLSDRATYLSMEDLDLTIIIEGDDKLFNQYGVLVVNPEKNDLINEEGAKIFADWMVSPETQALINTFGVEKYGKPLFFANAK